MSKLWKIGIHTEVEGWVAIPAPHAGHVPRTEAPARPDSGTATMLAMQVQWQQAEQTAADLLNEARVMQEEILAQALWDAQVRQQQGYAEGYQRGYENGMAAAALQGDQLVEQRLQQALEVVKVAQQTRERMLAATGSGLSKVVMRVVEILLRRELTVAPANIESMVTALLQQVRDATRVEVHVSSNDYQAAVAAYPSWQSAKLGTWEVAVVPDAGVSTGGCQVFSEAGRLDATIETQLERMQEVLNQYFAEEGTSLAGRVLFDSVAAP
ncbi:hypothetical protein D2Q93_00630 [Alicyclobacillaceae bacterium I2511]|nr:hypothetical protein D2Q93_00630 [Alicyclobacillaceae bacterium I2511]